MLIVDLYIFLTDTNSFKVLVILVHWCESSLQRWIFYIDFPLKSLHVYQIYATLGMNTLIPKSH